MSQQMLHNSQHGDKRTARIKTANGYSLTVTGALGGHLALTSWRTNARAG